APASFLSGPLAGGGRSSKHGTCPGTPRRIRGRRPITDNARVGERRGHHKVFLGMAAGVGKTYRMLQEAQAEAAEGRDVVIGYLEPHGRSETAYQAKGLEVIPHRRIPHGDTVLEEMDL